MIRKEDKMKKIYAITHRAYEFDDLGYPDLVPIKFFSTKEKRDKVFEELISKKMAWFEKCKADDVKYYGSQLHADEEYYINTNDGSVLELYMGNWCYEWCKTEFELED